nr:MAG TPA: hypothetical protein [Caudoviricetes sp.]
MRRRLKANKVPKNESERIQENTQEPKQPVTKKKK